MVISATNVVHLPECYLYDAEDEARLSELVEKAARGEARRTR
jgi:hypothetical protein